MWKVTQDRNIETREYVIPDGWEIVSEYHPHSCPWDYYGNKHITEIRRVLMNVGIESVSYPLHRKIISPRGTGPGGSVRFGDDMMPSVYRICVESKNVVAARAAIEDFEKRIKE